MRASRSILSALAAVLLVATAACEHRGTAPTATATALPQVSTPSASAGAAVAGESAASREREGLSRIRLPRGTTAITVGRGSVWASDGERRSIVRIDAGSGAARRIRIGKRPADVAFGRGAAWVVTADRRGLIRIDAATNSVMAVVDLTGLALPRFEHLWVTVGSGAVWLVGETSVVQIDSAANRIVGRPLVVGEEVIAFATGEGTLWTGSHDDGVIARVDARTHAVVATVETGFSVHGLAVGDGSAWVLDEHGFAVVHLDPDTNRLGGRVPIDFVAANLAAGGGSVWVAPAARNDGEATGNDALARIDVRTWAVAETISIGGAATSEYYELTYDGRSAWVHISSARPSAVRIRQPG